MRVDVQGKILGEGAAERPLSRFILRLSALPRTDVPKIFINYRREDAAAAANAGRLNDRLGAVFGEENVFMDVDTLKAGSDFVKEITNSIAACDALIALIGGEWLTVKDDEGLRRLDDPEDFVRLEIEIALARDVQVIPALVDGASMPRSEDLPDSLRKLTRRHAVDITHKYFHRDVDRLIKDLPALQARVPEPPTIDETRQPDDGHQRIQSLSNRLYYPTVGLLAIASIVYAFITRPDNDDWLIWYTGAAFISAILLWLVLEKTTGKEQLSITGALCAVHILAALGVIVLTLALVPKPDPVTQVSNRNYEAYFWLVLAWFSVTVTLIFARSAKENRFKLLIFWCSMGFGLLLCRVLWAVVIDRSLDSI